MTKVRLVVLLAYLKSDLQEPFLPVLVFSDVVSVEGCHGVLGLTVIPHCDKAEALALTTLGFITDNVNLKPEELFKNIAFGMKKRAKTA